VEEFRAIYRTASMVHSQRQSGIAGYIPYTGGKTNNFNRFVCFFVYFIDHGESFSDFDVPIVFSARHFARCLI